MFEEHHNDTDNTTILDALLMEEIMLLIVYDSYMNNTLVCQLYKDLLTKNM